MTWTAFEPSGGGNVSVRPIGARPQWAAWSRVGLLLLLALGGLRDLGLPRLRAAETPAGPAALPRIFQVEGNVREIDLPARQVKILHDEIPGYMKRMVMLFDVKDASDLGSLHAGDRVRFRMVVTEDDGWIEQLTRLGSSAPATAPNQTTNLPASAPFLPPLMVGDPVPVLAFTNQFGRHVTLSQYRGQALAFTFVFTTCPFPTMCPRMTTNFKAAQALLRGEESGATNWHFFSISIDPRTDTPDVLERYASGQGADLSRWSFLTGDERQIESFGGRFGLSFMRESGVLNHNLRTVVVTPEGRVAKVLVGNEWKSSELAQAIRRALSPPENGR